MLVGPGFGRAGRISGAGIEDCGNIGVLQQNGATVKPGDDDLKIAFHRRLVTSI